jgi:hypothetical protein
MSSPLSQGSSLHFTSALELALRRSQHGVAFSNRLWQRSQHEHKTARDVLQEVGVTDEEGAGLGVDGVLRVLGQLGVELSEEERRMAEAFVAKQHGGMARLRELQTFLSDLCAAREEVGGSRWVGRGGTGAREEGVVGGGAGRKRRRRRHGGGGGGQGRNGGVCVIGSAFPRRVSRVTCKGDAVAR